MMCGEIIFRSNPRQKALRGSTLLVKCPAMCWCVRASSHFRTERSFDHFLLLSWCLRLVREPAGRDPMCRFTPFVGLCFNWSEFKREVLRSGWERFAAAAVFHTAVQDELYHVSSKQSEAAVTPNCIWQNGVTGFCDGFMQVCMGVKHTKHYAC